MPKNDYWKKRMEALEDLQYQKSQEYYSDVQKQYDNALRKIQKDTEVWYARLAENNDISYAEAKKFLKDSDLEEFKWNVEQYIKAGRENAIDESWMKELENASAKFHISRLEAIQMQIRQHVELLKAQFEWGLTEHLTESFQDQFYRNAFEIANGTGIGTNLSKWDPEKVDMVIRTPWAQDGKAFSDRIWDNKEKLVINLHTELSQCIIRGEAPDTAIKNLAKKMNVSKKQAGNLIMTETAAISAMAQQKCFSELGIEEFEVVETLDGHTCDICQGMDSLHFPMNDFKVGVTAPPFHPRCRGCTCPYFNDEFTEGEERSARNQVTGKTEYVEDITYEEWKKIFAEGDKTELQVDTMTFMQKKEAIYENEKQIDRLYNQKKEAELKILTGSSLPEIEAAQQSTLTIGTQIEDLKAVNRKLQESLGLPENAKERFYDQKVDVSTLPQDVQSDTELGAIGSWTRTDYVQINDYLRNENRGVRPESIANAETLKRMIDRNVVQEPFTVKRGTNFNAMNHLFKSDKWKEPGYNVSGRIITDKGFVATSPDLHGGFGGGVQMYIDVPKGAKGIYLGDLSAAPDEKEFLLQCSTSFYVEKIEIRYNVWNEPEYDVYLKVKVGD